MAAVARISGVAKRAVLSRSFSISAAPRKDFVQDLYLRELKSYKPKEAAKDAHVGQVKEFHTPSAPKTPEILSSQDLAAQLQNFASEDPAAAQSAPQDSAHDSTFEEGADEYLRAVQTDVQPAATGHH